MQRNVVLRKIGDDKNVVKLREASNISETF